GIDAEDYHTDQLLSDIGQRTRGYFEIAGSLWDRVDQVVTVQSGCDTLHRIPHGLLVSEIPAEQVYPNQYLIDEQGFVGRIRDVEQGVVTIQHLKRSALMEQHAWGLKPINIHQAIALHLLLDPDAHLVTLTGAAGSGKTILALAAA